MKKGDKVGIVCCSNGQPQANREQLHKLEETLLQIGLIPVFSDYIYEKESAFSGTALKRANALMQFYRAEDIVAIFDISGGDIANEILPYMDFALIAASKKQFWGYSDLTTIINAIYAKTGKTSVLYQVRNIIYSDSATQIKNFSTTVLQRTNELYDLQYKFVQGDSMQGIVVGGNIRCLLKLAGTPYWPDMQGKVLLLEACSGLLPQMTTYLSQLQQMGVFEKISGIILGTFTELEKQNGTISIEEQIKQFVGADVAIIKTNEIGHGADSKGIVIGEAIDFQKS
jgi:muramoyltetrapeptide carboxypeptidase LdcA involved in peptidoglycan recycling